MQLTDHNRERSSGVIPERYNSASLTRSLAPKLQNPLHVPGQVRFRMGYDGWKPWGTAVNDADRPVRNPHVVLREEFDDWAVLFDPDTGRGFGLSPTGVYVWKLLNGEHTTDDLLKELRSYADDVPKEALEHVGAFIDELAAEGLAGFGSTGSGLPASVKRPESFPSPPSGRVCELKSFKYEPPKLIDLSGGRHEAYGDSCSPGSFASNNCYPTGNSAGGICFPGTSASYCYANGTAPGHANCLSGGSTIAECNYGTGASGYCDTGSGT